MKLEVPICGRCLIGAEEASVKFNGPLETIVVFRLLRKTRRKWHARRAHPSSPHTRVECHGGIGHLDDAHVDSTADHTPSIWSLDWL